MANDKDNSNQGQGNGGQGNQGNQGGGQGQGNNSQGNNNSQGQSEQAHGNNVPGAKGSKFERIGVSEAEGNNPSLPPIANPEDVILSAVEAENLTLTPDGMYWKDLADLNGAIRARAAAGFSRYSWYVSPERVQNGAFERVQATLVKQGFLVTPAPVANWFEIRWS